MVGINLLLLYYGPGPVHPQPPGTLTFKQISRVGDIPLMDIATYKNNWPRGQFVEKRSKMLGSYENTQNIFTSAPPPALFSNKCGLK